MFETIKNGGLLMIPIILCGFFAVFIIAERFYYFFTVKKRDAELMIQLRDSLRLKDYSAAEASCAIAGTPTGEVAREMINHRKLSENDLREVVQSKMDSVVPKFEHLLTALNTISNISTLLGLLGTVTGNIKAFGVLGNGGTMGDPAALANAIAQALVTTVGGLVVAIPAIVFANYFSRKVKHSVNLMEQNVTSLMYNILGKEM